MAVDKEQFASVVQVLHTMHLHLETELKVLRRVLENAKLLDDTAYRNAKAQVTAEKDQELAAGMDWLKSLGIRFEGDDE